MGVPTSTLREFLRYVYDEGGATEATRNAFVSTWREDALSAVRSGGVLTSSSANGKGIGFSIDRDWTAQRVMELADLARGFLGESTITLSLAEVPSRVRSYRTATTYEGVYG